MLVHIDGLRHETSGLCEKIYSIYIVFTSYHVQVIWEFSATLCLMTYFLFHSSFMFLELFWQTQAYTYEIKVVCTLLVNN